MKHDPADDALEAELHSLRPRELPDRLVRRHRSVAHGRRRERNGPARDARLRVRCRRRRARGVRRRRRLALARRKRRAVAETPHRSPSPPVRPSHAQPHGGRPDGVTLGEYRAAFARSPEAMDALLEQDAPRPPDPPRGRQVFVRSTARHSTWRRRATRSAGTARRAL